jgi:hypothetical protein
MKDSYTISEFARLVDREEFTIRELCRLGRITAVLHYSGTGGRREWRIPRDRRFEYPEDGIDVSEN